MEEICRGSEVRAFRGLDTGWRRVVESALGLPAWAQLPGINRVPSLWVQLPHYQMGGPIERSQTEKDKHCMVLFLCGILKKKKKEVRVMETEHRDVVVRA